MMRPEMPNDWLALDRSRPPAGGHLADRAGCLSGRGHLLVDATSSSSGSTATRSCTGEADLISLEGASLRRTSHGERVIPRLNARFRLCVDLLEYPVTILISKNLPLAGLVVSAAAGLVIFVWGVVWPRFIPTPEGMRFDLLVVVGRSCATCSCCCTPRCATSGSGDRCFASSARSRSCPWPVRSTGSLRGWPPSSADSSGPRSTTTCDLEIPLQQCRLVLDQGEPAGDGPQPLQKPCVTTVAPGLTGRSRSPSRSSSDACVRPVVELAGPAGRSRRPTAARSAGEAGQAPAAEPRRPPRPAGLDPATLRWLAMAEDLLALRIVYLVSQFAAPLRSMSAQLIYGPILLLLAVAWYPFHPQRLMSIMIWVFIAGGVLVTLVGPHPDRAQRLRQPGLPDRPQRDQARSDLLHQPAPLRRARRRLRADRISLARLLARLAAEPIGRAVK